MPRYRIPIGMLFLLATAAVVLAPAAHAARTTLVADGLERPNLVTAPPWDLRLFIVEQRGVIRILEGGELLETPFLDIDDLVVDIGGFDERGLLGLAFHPDYDNNGQFFVYYTNNESNSVVARYEVSADPDVADPASAQIVLTVDQPFENHNGGMLAFGLEGYLYIGLGDGGSAGDPGNRAQDLTTLLGKMLRIDVDGGAPYAIPPDNPFVGTPDALDEIWAYGLRNPWRYSFDRETSDLWIGDVGQSSWEEIDFQPAASSGGENYGWRLMEGSHCYNPPVDCDDGTLTHPIYEYDHESGRCSVTGGYVYRGAALPELQGQYFFGDFCTGEIWSFREEGGEAVDVQDRTAELSPGGGLSIDFIASFGEDGFGELYVIDRGDGTNGEVFKIVPETADVGGAEGGSGGAPGGVGGTEQGTNRLFIEPPVPNPSGGSVLFAVEVGRAGPLTVEITDVAGRIVRTAREGEVTASRQEFRWDGRDAQGREAGPGVYFIRARMGEDVATRSVRLLR